MLRTGPVDSMKRLLQRSRVTSAGSSAGVDSAGLRHAADGGFRIGEPPGKWVSSGPARVDRVGAQ
jgi:hypothetical protein